MHLKMPSESDMLAKEYIKLCRKYGEKPVKIFGYINIFSEHFKQLRKREDRERLFEAD